MPGMTTTFGTARRSPRIRRWRRACVVALGMLTVHLAAPLALAQRVMKVAEDDKGLLQWGIAAGLAVVVCVASFVGPRRSQPKQP